MQYAVYITRAEHWSFEYRERIPIAEAEWLAYVASDPEFRLAIPKYAVPISGSGPKILIEMPGLWEWTGHPAPPGELPTFQYLRAGLIVRAPDEHTLQKAREVARALQARVFSDEEEVY